LRLLTLLIYEKFVRRHSAIVIDTDKEYLVHGRLSSIVDRKGFTSIDEMIHSLQGKPFGALHQHVVDASREFSPNNLGDHPAGKVSRLPAFAPQPPIDDLYE
jgi:hypothetical protein